MKKLNKRAKATFKEVLAKFLKSFMEMAKSHFGENVAIIQDLNYLRIEFKFCYISCREVYVIIGKAYQEIGIKGYLKKLITELAKVTNIDLRDDNINQLETRVSTIYRSENRYNQLYL